MNNTSVTQQFIETAEAMGIKAHLAETAEKANEIIAGIAGDTGSKTMVKSKSMTCREPRQGSQGAASCRDHV